MGGFCVGRDDLVDYPSAHVTHERRAPEEIMPYF